MTNEEYIKQHPEQFKDGIDKWLFKELGIIGGCCSAEKSHEYSVARMVAERLFSTHPLPKEPASEDLTAMAVEYEKNLYDSNGTRDYSYIDIIDAFEDGAKCQYEQFEKNRLAACDRQTEEEAQRESDFVMGIIEKEHRQPTFDDAIEYGMKLKEEQMQNSQSALDFAYFSGSEAMRYKMINKACEWLNEQKEMVGVSFSEDFITRFRKAMEKE